MRYRLKAIHHAVRYTDPDSCQLIFDTFGSTGFVNTEQGLYVFHNKTGKTGNNYAKKGSWLVGNAGDIVIVSDEEFKKNYEPVEELC